MLPANRMGEEGLMDVMCMEEGLIQFVSHVTEISFLVAHTCILILDRAVIVTPFRRLFVLTARIDHFTVLNEPYNEMRQDIVK